MFADLALWTLPVLRISVKIDPAANPRLTSPTRDFLAKKSGLAVHERVQEGSSAEQTYELESVDYGRQVEVLAGQHAGKG